MNKSLLRLVALTASITVLGCPGEPEKTETKTPLMARAKTAAPGDKTPARTADKTKTITRAKTVVTKTPAAKPLEKPTERWYEIVVRNQKIGWQKVTWAPSTWKGKRTIHDTTSIVRRSVRNMSGYKTVFETSVTVDLERGYDGTLWHMKTVVTEADRLTVETLTWNGKGYDQKIRVGQDDPQLKHYPLSEPVVTDSEAFLSQRVKQAEIQVGDTFEYRILDERARKAKKHTLKVESRETVQGPTDLVSCLKIVDQDPDSGSRTWLWMDAAGAFVRIKTDRGVKYNQVSRKQARGMPDRPAEFSVTTPSEPPLARVMSADRMWVDVHLQGDADRELPKFPESPWSRALKTKGSNADGWTIQVELTSYDKEDAQATLPVDAKRFQKELEPTPLMPATHPDLRSKAREVMGGEKDARKAAWKLARYVHNSLAKASPDVASTTALEILKEGRGDCSEHCVLFVALCRAGGIPARRCSGYVNIGNTWGAHAWAEIWVGDWIGADPTTGEVGTAARYIFFGYPDRPGSYPRQVSDMVSGRLRLISTKLQEGEETYDLTKISALRRHDVRSGRYLHVLSGIEARDVPAGWNVRLTGNGYAHISGGTLQATLRAVADQGDRLENLFGRPNGTYAGAPAFYRKGMSWTNVWVHSRRRFVELTIRGGSKQEQATLETILEPTFSDTVTAPRKKDPKKAGDLGGD